MTTKTTRCHSIDHKKTMITSKQSRAPSKTDIRNGLMSDPMYKDRYYDGASRRERPFDGEDMGY